jgi:transcriptional regulator with XRE-family HTH domain
MNDTEKEMNLREMLQEAGLTQKYIAQKANVSPAAVSLIVSGKSKSKRIVDIIKEEATKAMEKKQEQ